MNNLCSEVGFSSSNQWRVCGVRLHSADMPHGLRGDVTDYPDSVHLHWRLHQLMLPPALHIQQH